MNDQKRYLIRQYLVTTIFIVVTFVIYLSIGLTLSMHDLIYSWIIYVPCLLAIPFVSMKYNNFIIDISKTQRKFSAIISLTTVIFVSKYLLVVLPLIIALIIKLANGPQVFNIYGLVGMVFIYPLTLNITYIWKLKKKGGKENDSKQSITK